MAQLRMKFKGEVLLGSCDSRCDAEHDLMRQIQEAVTQNVDTMFEKLNLSYDVSEEK